MIINNLQSTFPRSTVHTHISPSLSFFKHHQQTKSTMDIDIASIKCLIYYKKSCIRKDLSTFPECSVLLKDFIFHLHYIVQNKHKKGRSSNPFHQYLKFNANTKEGFTTFYKFSFSKKSVLTGEKGKHKQHKHRQKLV